MKAVHYGARSSGPMKAKPKQIPKKEPVQPRREAHPCDCYTFSTIQAQKTKKKYPEKTKKNTQKKPGPLRGSFECIPGLLISLMKPFLLPKLHVSKIPTLP